MKTVYKSIKKIKKMEYHSQNKMMYSLFCMQITYLLYARKSSIESKESKKVYICCIIDPRIRPERRLKNRPLSHSSP